MTGPILNVLGILIGGALGLGKFKGLGAARETLVKVLLGVFTIYFGLRLTCQHLNSSLLPLLKQLIIIMLGLILGKGLGGILRLQRLSNYLGQTARMYVEEAAKGVKQRPGVAFKTGTILFCSAPLGFLGAIIDGLSLSSYPYPLLLKGMIDGLATMAFVCILGPAIILAALPVLCLQGTISLLSSQYLEPFLRTHGLLDSVYAVAGLLVFSVALVVLEIKKVPLTEYLPALFLAPAVSWVFR